MEIKQEELSQAFQGDRESPQAENVQDKKEKSGKPKSRIVSIVVFVLGIFALGTGVTFLILKLNQGPVITDAEYITSKGEWALEEDGGEAVIWNFSEIGKGTLTTNSHTNDYDFIWAIDGDKLKIETKWLYTLNNEYSYTLDREKDELSLQDGENELVFKPSSGSSAEKLHEDETDGKDEASKDTVH